MPSAPVTLAVAAAAALAATILPRIRKGLKRRSLENIIIKGTAESPMLAVLSRQSPAPSPAGRTPHSAASDCAISC